MHQQILPRCVFGKAMAADLVDRHHRTMRSNPMPPRRARTTASSGSELAAGPQR
jgi:hypothetical protein